MASFWFTRAARIAPATVSVVSVTPASVSETSGEPPLPDPPPPPRLTCAALPGKPSSTPPAAPTPFRSEPDPPPSEPAPSPLSVLVFSSLPPLPLTEESRTPFTAALECDLSSATARAAATDPFTSPFMASATLDLVQARYRSSSLGRSGCTSTLSHVHASYGRPHHLMSTLTFS